MLPHRSVVDVHLILERPDGCILLAERAGGYGAGALNIPGGKLEDGEDALTAAVREAREELGIDVEPEQVRGVSVVHHRSPDGHSRVGFFFATRVWVGEPINAEPDKCAGLLWVDPRHLPAHTIAYTAAGIRAYLNGTPIVLDGWQDGYTLTIGEHVGDALAHALS